MRKIAFFAIVILLTTSFISVFSIETVRAAPPLTFKYSVNAGVGWSSVGPLAADVNNDGKMEIIRTGTDGVVVLNGATGAVIDKRLFSMWNDHCPAEIIDLNKDGILEIITAHDTGTWALRGNNLMATPLWDNPDAPLYNKYCVAGDIGTTSGNTFINNILDGYPEVFVCVSGSQDGLNGTGSIHALTHDGQIFAETWTYYPCFGGLTLGDTDFDGVFELYQGDRDAYYHNDGMGRGCVSFWASNLTYRWGHPEMLMSSSCPMLVDVNKDGKLDVVCAAQDPSGGFCVYDSTTGANMSTDYPRSSPRLRVHSQTTVSDVDNDGNLEIIACEESIPIIWDLVLRQVDASLPHKCYEPPAVADVDGDGKVEIIACNDSYMEIFKYNVVNNQYDLLQNISLSCPGFGMAMMVAQDVDADGFLELILNRGYEVYVYDTLGPAPTPRALSQFNFYSQHRGRAPYYTEYEPVAPIVKALSPANGSTGVSYNPQLQISVFDYQRQSMNITFRTNAKTGVWHDITTYTNKYNGIYTANTTEMKSPSTYYWWSVTATDSTGKTTSKLFKFGTIGTLNSPMVIGTPSPVNRSTGIPLSVTWSIPINDPEGYSFSWTIQCSNGQTNSGSGSLNGMKTLTLSRLTNATTYTVWVNATDPTPAGSGLWTRRWFTFTTQGSVVNSPPVYGTPSPVNGATGAPLSLTWSIPINDLNGNTFTWTIHCSNGQTSGLITGASNGTKSLSLTGLDYSTSYTVWVNATDPTGSGKWANKSYMFTTKANTPPLYGIPSPADGSSGNPLTLNWQITITDEEHNFNWNIECSNGQTVNGSSATNGTKSLSLSGLTYSTTYTIWVNATDPTPAGSGLYHYGVFTFKTKASGGGGGGGGTPSENKNPVADLSAGEPYHGVVNTAIPFDGSKSSDADGTITMWFWDFGDDTSGTGKTVTHTFSQAGNYTVTFMVTDDDGATHTDTTTCKIIQNNTTQPNRPPTKPVITGVITGSTHTQYTYKAVSTDADNDTIKYTFHWGDPVSLPQSSGFLPSGSGFTMNHSWTAAGRYEMTVTATDNVSTSLLKTTIYIDAVQTGTIGCLLDNNGDGIYDAFYSDSSKQITAVQEKNGRYPIDSDGDGDFEYTYSTTTGLTEYQTPLQPSGGIEPVLLVGMIIVIVVICGIVVVLLRKNKRI